MGRPGKDFESPIDLETEKKVIFHLLHADEEKKGKKTRAKPAAQEASGKAAEKKAAAPEEKAVKKPGPAAARGKIKPKAEAKAEPGVPLIEASTKPVVIIRRAPRIEEPVVPPAPTALASEEEIAPPSAPLTAPSLVETPAFESAAGEAVVPGAAPAEAETGAAPAEGSVSAEQAERKAAKTKEKKGAKGAKAGEEAAAPVAKKDKDEARERFRRLMDVIEDDEESRVFPVVKERDKAAPVVRKPPMRPRFPGDRGGGGRAVRDLEKGLVRPPRGGAGAAVEEPGTKARKKAIRITEGATVKDFAEAIGVKASEVLKRLMGMGMMAMINQPIDPDAAVLVADGLGIKAEIVPVLSEEALIEEAHEEEGELTSRPPVVTIMGHVDHGKTSLLDAIRETNVTQKEAGGITQHIGAYHVTLRNRSIVFLDTPGHEAFTAMRARGAQVTDVVVLVVAADDGVMPQTREAINHARAANVPIIVAINKIDKPDARPDRVKKDLAELGLISEDWGGTTIFVEVSAKKKTGLDNLLEMILLQSDVLDLKADAGRLARGVVIEAKLDRGRGPVATVLIQKGTLRPGDAFVAGAQFGRARTLLSDHGERLDAAPPSTPVEVIGFTGVPAAGDTFVAVPEERQARQIATLRMQKVRELELARSKRLTLNDLYEAIQKGEVKELPVIIKGDVQGSIEAIADALGRAGTEAVKVRVIHSSVGGINETDINLAEASNAIIIGFSVRAEAKAAAQAEKSGVDIRLYNIIYDAVDDIKAAMAGLLEPILKEKITGRAQVRQVFSVPKIGTIAGCYVLDGTISRQSAGARVIRDSVVVYEGKIGSLRRFKDDVREVQSGYECGIGIENFGDLKAGDEIEVFVVEKEAATL
ncbi:MAG: translation initiation factor IF-2 [Nitrospirae bacterium]|nr:translation initiation factor IF-2 [Nitrospirota bacterium]